MQENIVNRVGFVIAAVDGDRISVLLVKSRPGRWRLPSVPLSVAITQCNKDALEPFRIQLNLGKTSYVNSVFFRDSLETGQVTRFYALRSDAPEQALRSTAFALNCHTKWASFEEATWIVAAEELEVIRWGERLLLPKTASKRAPGAL